MEGLVKLLMDASDQTSPMQLVILFLLAAAIVHPFMKSYYVGQGEKKRGDDPDATQKLIDRGRELEKMDALLQGQREQGKMLAMLDDKVDRSLLTAANHDGRITTLEARMGRIETTVGITPNNHA